MSLILWSLMILAPNEAAGRTVGPFATKQICEAAAVVYNARNGGSVSPQSVCVSLVTATKAKD